MSAHSLVESRKVASGWVAICKCGRVSGGTYADEAEERHTDHATAAAVAEASSRVFGDQP